MITKDNRQNVGEGSAPISLLIVDDHALIRENWRYILERDPRFLVLADCENAVEALELVKKLQPDVVLMDINLDGTDGIEATEQISRTVPKTRVIGVSLHNQVNYVQAIFEKGAYGYVTKNSGREELYQAIVDAHGGNKYICREIRDHLTLQKGNGMAFYF